MTKLTMSEPLIFDGEVSCWLIFGEKRALLLPKHGHFTEKEFTDAAKHLVKCANCHDTLLAACEFAVNPGAPYKTDRLAFANSIIAAIAEGAKAAIAEVESEE